MLERLASRKLASLFLVLLAVAVWIYVRLEVTWGQADYDGRLIATTVAGFASVVLAIWVWRKPAARWLALIVNVAALAWLPFYLLTRVYWSL